MSGDSEDYSETDIDELLEWMRQAFDNFTGGDTMTVRARIEWSGEHNRKAVRTTTIGGMDLNRVKQATDAAVAARNARSSGRPAPKSLGAMLRDLGRNRAGREALNGIATPRTQARWASGKQSPSKANRERIERASRERWEAIRDAREQRYREAAREAADELTRAVEEVAGGDPRFRDIEDLRFE